MNRREKILALFFTLALVLMFTACGGGGGGGGGNGKSGKCKNEREPNDTPDTATSISPGDCCYTGSLSDSDMADVWTFTGNGQRVHLYLDPPFTADFDLTLFESATGDSKDRIEVKNADSDYASPADLGYDTTNGYRYWVLLDWSEGYGDYQLNFCFLDILCNDLEDKFNQFNNDWANLESTLSGLTPGTQAYTDVSKAFCTLVENFVFDLESGGYAEECYSCNGVCSQCYESLSSCMEGCATPGHADACYDNFIGCIGDARW
jgi:hypothetical protein